MARAEAGLLTITPQKVGVSETLKHCIGGMRLDAALGGKPLLLADIDDTLSVHADPQRLAQIINNLIANSYKYGDNDSPIRIRASRVGKTFGRIEILNSGPGISLHGEREAMFKPFETESGGRTVAGRGPGPFHRQAAGRDAGRPHRFREHSGAANPLLGGPAAGGLKPLAFWCGLPLRAGLRPLAA